MAGSKLQSAAFAKTTRPVIGNFVRREELFTRLEGSNGRIAAWISGPAGSGKTMLASSYVETRRYQCLWYQIDPDDTDIATFFHYLGHAARKLDDGRGAALPTFTPQHGDDIAAFSRKFFRQLFARAKPPCALVLDNLDALTGDGPLDQAIEAGIGQVPKDCCLIVTSRSEPPPSLARLRGSGQLVCIGWDELRIGPQELAAIAKMRGQTLSAEAVAKLHERTQGWAAGLVLMLEHAKICGGAVEVPTDATPQVIFDYFAGEIFDRFEPAARAFLLKVAYLPRMTVEVAETLSGESKAGLLLLNLAHNDYFVREISADGSRIYQIHPLLRDFLRSRALQDLPEASSPDRLRFAAGLLREAGYSEDAVTLLVDGGDWAEVARIAASEADAMLAQGRGELLGSWLELLPPQLLDADGRLLYAYGCCRTHASPRAAVRLFESAFQRSDAAGDQSGMARNACGIVDTILFEFDDLAPLDRWLRLLADLLERPDSGAAAAADAKLVAALTRGLLLRDPASDLLARWLEHGVGRTAAETHMMPETTEATIARAVACAVVALLRGDFAAAQTGLNAISAPAAEVDAGAFITVELASALQYLLAGNHEAALTGARDTLAFARAEGVHGFDRWLRLIVVAALLETGDHGAAVDELQRLEAAGARAGRGERALMHLLRAMLAAQRGDEIGALKEMKAALLMAAELGLPWLECLLHIDAAALHAAAGNHPAAAAQLRAAEALNERLRSPLLEFSIGLARADAALQAKEEDAAAEVLEKAFTLGREHSLVPLPGMRREGLAELCAFALRRNLVGEFAGTMVRERHLAPPPAAQRVRQWPWLFRISTFGGFRLLRESTAVEFTGKGPGRPIELLKVLVSLGGRSVRADQIADCMWPHVDADYAHNSFNTALHRLRGMLNSDDVLQLADGRLSLNPALCWLDTWALERELIVIDDAVRASRRPIGASTASDDLEPVIALYRGPYLPDESEQPSYIAAREQIRAKLLRCVARRLRSWEEAGAWDAVADIYLRLIDADELCEAFYRNLMLCYQRSGNPIEAQATFERLRTLLSARLNAEPSAETRALFATLRTAGSTAS